MTEAQTVTLPDGRLLAYSEFGAPGGTPVLYQHGWPGSRLEAGLMDSAASDAGVRLISPDRPGMGQSTFLPGRQLLDWPSDLGALADHLDLDQFHIFGTSGGGPYTIACLSAMPERLLGSTIAAGVSPMRDPKTQDGMRLVNRLLLAWAPRIPLMLPLLMRLTKVALTNPKLYAKALADLPQVDRDALQGGGVERLSESARASFAQGISGVEQEARIYNDHWNIDMTSISAPVTIWQGSLDVNVPASNSEILVYALPNATLRILEGEGHLSSLVNHGTAILEALVAD